MTAATVARSDSEDGTRRLDTEEHVEAPAAR